MYAHISEKCKIIAIANQKGGVGKTTTCANLGVGLAQEGKRVLLIDSDPQGSLPISLGFTEPDKLLYTLSTAMMQAIEDQPVTVAEGILRHEEKVDLLPANIELAGLEVSLINAMSREKILKQCLEPLKRDYDYILIDCMPSLGLLTINALAAADSVLIPTQPSFLSAKGLNLLLQSVGKVRRFINPALQIAGILMTMVDGRTNNARQIIESMREGIGQRIRIFDTMIPHSVRAAECPNEGVSIFRHDPDGKVAEAYSNLTGEVIQLGRKEKDRSRDYGFR